MKRRANRRQDPSRRQCRPGRRRAERPRGLRQQGTTGETLPCQIRRLGLVVDRARNAGVIWGSRFALLMITACTPSHEMARQGRNLVIGMDATALQACAGIPTRTAQIDPATQLYSYENKYERTGGLEITLPIIGGGIAAGGSGSYCHALVRIVDGKVAGVTYTGDNDEMIGREGVCGPIFRGCLREQEKARAAHTAGAG